MDPWGSHLPVLVAFARMQGDFVELGCGDYSTPILHEIYASLPGEQRPRLLSLENNPEFTKRFLHLRREWHKILLVPTWKVDDPTLRVLLQMEWTVAFVDQHPGKHRGPAITLLRDRTRFIIAHDTENPLSYGYEPLLSSFKYRMDYKPLAACCPWTTVVSDVSDPKEIFDGR